MKLKEGKVCNKVGIAVVISLILLSSSMLNSAIVDTYEDNIELTNTPFGAIYINGDLDFGPSGYNFNGSGTAENPFIIEGYNITTTDNIGINIEGTTKHFIVRNCYVYAENYGIYIYNATDGTATIENNTCSNHNYY